MPFWTVLRGDIRQTVRSWMYLLGMGTYAALGLGLVLHRAAMYRQAGLSQSAAALLGELLFMALVSGATWAVFLSAGAISGERQLLADAILCRGVSRYQYYAGKWMARVVLVSASFLFCGAAIAGIGLCLLHYDVRADGVGVALLWLASVFAAVVTLGVSVSALSESTLFSVVVVWLAVHGLGVLFTMLQLEECNPIRLCDRFSRAMREGMAFEELARSLACYAGATLLIGLVGAIGFARRDI
ncbi:MAG: hypothetical protein C4297_14270 [Gemmataceae bacterium]